VQSRASATSGNNVGIVHAGKEPVPMSKTNPVETSLSGEDDRIERATILQSPSKGMKRLSSGVSALHFSYCFLTLVIGYCHDRQAIVHLK
jgi:hypothetical protein